MSNAVPLLCPCCLSSCPSRRLMAALRNAPAGMLNPIPMPNFVGSDCDDMSGHPCGGCPCGSKYPGGNVNEGVCVDDICYGKNPIQEGESTALSPLSLISSYKYEKSLCGAGTQMGHSTAIEDEVRVPAALPAGEYVVGFRWDCETSSQVWTSCAVRARTRLDLQIRSVQSTAL